MGNIKVEHRQMKQLEDAEKNVSPSGTLTKGEAAVHTDGILMEISHDASSKSDVKILQIALKL